MDASIARPPGWRHGSLARGLSCSLMRYRLDADPRTFHSLVRGPATHADPAETRASRDERKSASLPRQADPLHRGRGRSVPTLARKLAGHLGSCRRHGSPHRLVTGHDVGAIHFQERENTTLCVADSDRDRKTPMRCMSGRRMRNRFRQLQLHVQGRFDWHGHFHSWEGRTRRFDCADQCESNEQ